jgi:hypothetical protein
MGRHPVRAGKDTRPGVDLIKGRMVPGKGNVEDVHVIWTLRALDQGSKGITLWTSVEAGP